MGAIIATLRLSGLSFIFYLRRCRMPAGTNDFPHSEFGESFAHLFRFVAMGIENCGGNYDLAAMVTMRRRHMKRTIKGVDFIP